MEESPYQQREKEYSVQHFGFDPSNFVEELTEFSVNEVVDSLGKIKEKIKKTKKGKFKEDELDQSIENLERLYKTYFEEKFSFVTAYLDQNLFKVPRHVLLREDSAWDGLTQAVARSQLTAANTEMERMRERYKNCLSKKAYLKNYVGKLKYICIKQEEAIQKEAGLKEDHGLFEGEDTLGFLATQGTSLIKKVRELASVKASGLRKRKVGDGPQLSGEKRRRLESNFLNKLPSTNSLL